MRAEEIRELNDGDIRDRLAELEEERFRLRFRSATETLDEPLRLRVIRREVARMKTVLRERALGKTPAVSAKKESAPAAPAKKAGRARKARGGTEK